MLETFASFNSCIDDSSWWSRAQIRFTYTLLYLAKTPSNTLASTHFVSMASPFFSKVVLLYQSTVMLSLSNSYHFPGQVLLSLIHNISPSLTRWWAAYHLPETSWSGWPLSRPINNQSDKSDTAQLPFHALNQSRQIKRVNTDKNAWKMDKMEAPGVLKKTPFLELFTLDTQ